MRTVVFIKDFAKKKKGDEGTYDGLLASGLVHKDKVAKYKPVEDSASGKSVSEELKETKDKLKAAEKKINQLEAKLKAK